MKPVARPYVPLWVKSNFSFLEGASHPEELVETAHKQGIAALALTDRDGVYGVVRGHVTSREHPCRVIIGAEVTLARSNDLYVHESLEAQFQKLKKHTPEAVPAVDTVVLLARTRAGYGNLCQLLTRGRLRSEKGSSRVTLSEVAMYAPGLIALSAKPQLLAPLKEAFGADLFAVIARHYDEREHADELALRAQARALGLKHVAATEVLYHSSTRRPLQDVMTCIRTKSVLANASAWLRGNAEHTLLSPEEMSRRYADDPAALDRTIEIAERCSFGLGEIRYRYPGERLPQGHTEDTWLYTLTVQGAHHRYGAVIPADVMKQLQAELALIHELQYEGYFLTMHEIVEYCRQQRILCQGRGSAANSAVCYCLGITAVDPVRMDLLFERFLSRERAEPPDIDLDIEHERREEVIQHVYEKYGRRHAAMVANLVRYRARSAIRDVGKVLGVPETALDYLAKLAGYDSIRLEPSALSDAGIDPESQTAKQLRELSTELLRFPRHLSVHPGGFLLGHETVDSLVPIEPATMAGRTVVQWDKHDVEDLGLFKVDLLGLGALTHTRMCLDLMRKHQNSTLEFATIPTEDSATYEMLTRGDTVGVFQIESRAQMSMLPRLKPKTFYDLVVQVAIVRPGPIQGQMVHPYLRRRDGIEQVEYPHPTLERVLKRTLGVPIFQEQVMKLAILAADYTPGEADQLRRDMAAWRRDGHMEKHRERLLTRMGAKGIPADFAERIFSQILGFAEYGFPESHAASFALIAYVTSWLKCHHPEAFYCSLLNAQPMGFYSPSTIVEDAKRHGITVEPILVGRSEWDCTLEADRRGALESHVARRADPSHFGSSAPAADARPRFALRMGYRWIRGIQSRDRQALEAANHHRDLATYVRQSGLAQPALLALAQSGALDGLGTDRRNAIWSIRAMAPVASAPMPAAPASTKTKLRALDEPHQVLWDYKMSSHSTRGHPMSALRPQLRAQGIPDARAVQRMPDGTRTEYVGHVICRQRPQTQSGVVFFTMEDETGFVNVVVWRQVFEQYEILARTASLLAIRGRLQRAHNVTHLIAESLRDPPLRRISNEAPPSRDFH